jgi:hypothetical protein
VHCWGSNEAGEVGDGTTLVRDRPVPVKGLDDAVQLTVRDRETCVRRRSGAVACWGEAFGTGRPGTNRLEPTEVPALRGATDLALGNGVLCGLVPKKGIVCLPAFKSDKAVREVGPPPGPPVSDAVDLAATANGLCAARRAGDVVCWNLRPFDDLAPEEREWKVEGVQGALALVAGLETVCALRSGNRAACWGGGIVTARGGIRDDIVGGVHDFGAVGAVTDLAFLGWPSDDDCATRVDGATVCWDQPFIELSARTEPRRVATRPMPLPAAVHVEATVDRSHCALTEAGDVYCWGELALGRLGVGRAPEQLGPRPIEGVEDVKLVVASDHRACARTKSGALTCWGGGHTPGRVKLDGLDRLLSGRCASVRHELACFGDLFTSPLPSSGLRDVVQLVPAAQGSNVLSYFALHQDGSVSRVEWTRDGSAWTLVKAARVAGLSGVNELLSVEQHTCIRDGKAGLACWASLGDPRFDDEGRVVVRLVKGRLPEGLDSVRLTRVMEDGRSEGCGLKGRGIACWDLDGEVTPVELRGVRQFDVSPEGVKCALLTGGTLQCWDGTYDGHGSRNGVSEPTPVPGLGAVEGFAFVQRSWNEDDAVFAWGRDGRVFAWGHNGGRWGEQEAGVLGWIGPRSLAEPTKVTMP